MESRFSPAEVARYRERYSEQGEALADRVYTSRLIGAEPGSGELAAMANRAETA